MLEHTPLDSSDLSIQHGEIRKTWHADSVFCILEGISWWQVRSRVIESHSANAKVGDILNWTETRWKWFESRSSWEGAYEILSMIWAPTTAVEEIWEEGWWDKDTTLPDAPPAPATDISGVRTKQYWLPMKLKQRAQPLQNNGVYLKIYKKYDGTNNILHITDEWSASVKYEKLNSHDSQHRLRDESSNNSKLFSRNIASHLSQEIIRRSILYFDSIKDAL